MFTCKKEEHLSQSILNYLKQIKDELSTQGIEKIGLFGSFAKKTNTNESDIDVAIKLKKNYLKNHDVWEYFTLVEIIKEKISKKFNRKSDIFDLDSKTDIKKQIYKEIIYV